MRNTALKQLTSTAKAHRLSSENITAKQSAFHRLTTKQENPTFQEKTSSSSENNDTKNNPIGARPIGLFL